MKPRIVAAALLSVFAFVMSDCVGLSAAERHYNVGLRLAAEESWTEAIAEYDGAIRLDSKLVRAYSSRGNACLNLGQPKLAIQGENAAIGPGPEHAQAYYYRALAYIALHRDQVAERDVAKAIGLGVDPAELNTAIEELNKRR